MKINEPHDSMSYGGIVEQILIAVIAVSYLIVIVKVFT